MLLQAWYGFPARVFRYMTMIEEAELIFQDFWREIQEEITQLHNVKHLLL